MTYDDLKKWIVKEFWNAAQVAGWVRNNFYPRTSFQGTSNGAASGNLPVKTDSTGKIDISLFNTPGDARYGRLATTNTWALAQTFSSGIVFANETLSAYDEGTWAVEIQGSVSNPTPTYTLQVGTYTKIGNKIFFSLDVRYSAISGGSGDVRVTLPFAARNTNQADSTPNAINTYNVTLDAAAQNVVFVVNQGVAYGTIQQTRSNTSAAVLQISALGASDIIVASGHYWV